MYINLDVIAESQNGGRSRCDENGAASQTDCEPNPWYPILAMR